MATVANAFRPVTAADLAGLKKAAQAMGTTVFELRAGGTLADFTAILNSLIFVKLGTTPSDTAADTILVGPAQALRLHCDETALRAIHNAVTDADATEFDALTGDTRASVLAWLADAIAVFANNADIASSDATWSENL